MASSIVDTVSSAIPSREALQQAHPGVAAAAELLLGQASKNKTADKVDAKLSPQPDKDAGKEAGFSGEGKDTAGEIPWRQVAGLLHSQGITDPQGLVSPLPNHLMSAFELVNQHECQRVLLQFSCLGAGSNGKSNTCE